MRGVVDTDMSNLTKTEAGCEVTLGMTELYETGALLPLQQIHPLLGSVMI